MAQKRKNIGGAAQLTATMAAGTLLALAVELAVLTAVSALVAAGRLGNEAILRGCCGGLFFGCLAGGCYTARLLRRRMLLLGLGIAAIHMLLWMAVGLLWMGQISFAAGGMLLLPALAGGALAGVLGAQLWHRA